LVDLRPEHPRSINDRALIAIYYLDEHHEFAVQELHRVISIGEALLAEMDKNVPEAEQRAVDEAVGDAYENLAYYQVFRLNQVGDAEKLLKEATDPKVSCDIKYNAIENLGRYGNDEVTRPIFQKLIEENKDPDHLWIGYEAAQAIGVPKQKDRKFIKWCENIIWGDYNSYVKEEIVGVLSDYKNHNPGEKQYILGILKKIYFDKFQSKFARDDAASILQYNLGKGSEKLYPKPEISDEEFDEHEANSPESLPFPQYCKNFQE